MFASLAAGAPAVAAVPVAQCTALLIWEMKSNLRDTSRKRKIVYATKNLQLFSFKIFKMRHFLGITFFFKNLSSNIAF